MKNERIAKYCVCCQGRHLNSTPAILMPFVADRAFGWKPINIEESWGLKTIKNGLAYSICNTLNCIHCGLIFLDIRFTNDELFNIYENYRDTVYTTLRESYEPGYTLRNKALMQGFQYTEKIELFLERHLNFPIKILDWGGDTGNNTPFKKNNSLFHIYDISQKEVIGGAKAIKKSELHRNSYDLIVCSNVIEHVPYPSLLLSEIRNCMRKNTILYIEVPYEQIMQSYDKNSYLNKKHWHEHINFFSEKSLLELTLNVGLEIVKFDKLQITAENKTAHLFQIICKISD